METLWYSLFHHPATGKVVTEDTDGSRPVEVDVPYARFVVEAELLDHAVADITVRRLRTRGVDLKVGLGSVDEVHYMDDGPKQELLGRIRGGIGDPADMPSVEETIIGISDACAFAGIWAPEDFPVVPGSEYPAGTPPLLKKGAPPTGDSECGIEQTCVQRDQSPLENEEHVYPPFPYKDMRYAEKEIQEARETPVYRAAAVTAVFEGKRGEKTPSYQHLRVSAWKFARAWVHRKAPAFWMSGKPTRLLGFKYDVVWSGEPPAPARAYRGSRQMEEAVEKHLRERLEMGDIIPGRGRYATAVFCVDKPGAPLGRLVCDYRKTNLSTQRYAGPSPEIWSTLRRVAGFRWGSLADFFNGFYHLELTDRAREALAIVSKGGLFEWVCLPFGPINGPQAFQAAMERAFCSGESIPMWLTHNHNPGVSSESCLVIRSVFSPTGALYISGTRFSPNMVEIGWS